jgi:hypothetical protein
MNFGTRIKRSLMIGLSALFLLGAIPAIVLAQNGASSNLTKEEIFKKSQEVYASLVSYSDEGKSVATLSGMTITTTFTTRLTRPSLYRITWEESNSSPFSPKSNPAAVWSAGEGDFLDNGWQTTKRESQEMALAGATGISADAAGEIPAAFFGTKWANPFCCLAKGMVQQADDKVGDVDCYVFAGGTKDQMRTIWIGKQDFLIHRIQEVTSAAGMKAALERAEKVAPPEADVPKIELTGSTSIETHWNIVLNQKFVAADFVPAKAK